MRKFAILIGIISALLLVSAPVEALDSLDINNLLDNPCPMGNDIGGVGCYTSSNPASYINNLISGSYGVRTIFGSLLLAMLIFYGIKLLLGSHNESTLSEIKSAYGQAIAGAALVGGAYLLADTFAGSTSSTALVVADPFNNVVGNVTTFIKALLATVVLLNIFIQGVRLIVSTDEGSSDNAKKRLLHGMIGAAFVILASTIVGAFYESRTASIMTNEIVGLARYVLTLFGGLAVIGLIVSGIMLVVSVDESLKDRAKKLIISSVVALAVAIAAFGITTIFI